MCERDLAGLRRIASAHQRRRARRMMRRAERPLPLHAGGRGALPAQTVRPFARPDRYPAGNSSAHSGGIVGPRNGVRRSDRADCRTGQCRARASAQPAGHDQSRTGGPASGRTLPPRRGGRGVATRSRRALRMVSARVLPCAEGRSNHRRPCRRPDAECGADRRGNPVSARFWFGIRRKICCQDLTYAHVQAFVRFRYI